MALDDRARWDKKHAAEQAMQKLSSFLKEIFEADSWPLPQRSSIRHRRGKGAQRDLFGGARFSGGGDRYLTGWSGNGTPDRPGKMSSHRLARRGSKLYRASQGVLRSGSKS